MKGVVWYRRPIELHESWVARVREGLGRVFIHFQGCNLQCEAWLDGEPIGRHRHAYVPFQLDATDALRVSLKKKKAAAAAAGATVQRTVAAATPPVPQNASALRALPTWLRNFDEAGDARATWRSDYEASAQHWLVVRVDSSVRDLEVI